MKGRKVAEAFGKEKVPSHPAPNVKGQELETGKLFDYLAGQGPMITPMPVMYDATKIMRGDSLLVGVRPLYLSEPTAEKMQVPENVWPFYRGRGSDDEKGGVIEQLTPCLTQVTEWAQRTGIESIFPPSLFVRLLTSFFSFLSFFFLQSLTH